MSDLFSNSEAVFKEVLKEKARLTPYELLTFLASEMNVASVEKDWRKAQPYDYTIKPFDLKNATWSLSDRLNTKTGAYFSSFNPKDKNTLTKVESTATSLKVDFGSKLPRLHETGGFIKSKGKMQYWFFAKYKETQNPFFKIMGASVIKKGGVNVKARPHFAPAIANFGKNIDVWLNDILNKLISKLNGI